MYPREKKSEWIEFDCKLSKVEGAIASYQITALQLKRIQIAKGEKNGALANVCREKVKSDGACHW